MKDGSTYRICEHCKEEIEGGYICACRKPGPTATDAVYVTNIKEVEHVKKKFKRGQKRSRSKLRGQG